MERLKNRRTGLRVVATLAILCAGFFVWAIMDRLASETINLRAKTDAQTILDRMSRDLDSRAELMIALAQDWTIHDSLPQDRFRETMGRFLSSLPGGRMIAITDDQFRLLATNQPAIGDRFRGRNIAKISPEREKAMTDARTEARVTLAGPFPFASDGKQGLILYAPGFAPDGTFQGILLQSMESENWMKALSLDAQASIWTQDYFVHLSVNEVTLLDHVPGSPPRNSARITGQILDQPVTVSLWPRPALVSAQRKFVPEVAAVLTVLVLLLLAITHAALRRARIAVQVAADLNRSLQDNNVALRKEVGERRKAEEVALSKHLASEKFLSTMTHEIRTPLNAIMGMFELLLRSGLPEKGQKYADAGLRAGKRLHQMLSNVLDVAQIEAGALAITPVWVNPRELAHGWSETLTAMIAASGKPLTAQVSVATDLPDSIHIDPQRVTQIVTNLLDNAVKFTLSGGVRMNVEMDSSGAMEVSVSDDGPGIPDALKDKVFERFYRTDAGKQIGSGTGLGLAISRELAQKMGASLNASLTGKYKSEIIFKLPIDENSCTPRPSQKGNATWEKSSLSKTILPLGS